MHTASSTEKLFADLVTYSHNLTDEWEFRYEVKVAISTSVITCTPQILNPIIFPYYIPIPMRSHFHAHLHLLCLIDRSSFCLFLFSSAISSEKMCRFYDFVLCLVRICINKTRCSAIAERPRCRVH